jgi:hypothetical protein
MSETEAKDIAVAEKVEPGALTQHIDHVSDGSDSAPTPVASWSLVGTLVVSPRFLPFSSGTDQILSHPREHHSDSTPLS